METRIAPNTKETRTLELRAGNNFEIVARAAKYNSLSEDLGGFKEVLSPGCFSDALADENTEVYCAVNHNPTFILGRTRNGSLVLSDEPDGLYFTCKLNRSIQAHQDIYEMCRSGLLSECSFAFTVDKDGQTWDDSTKPVTRRITKVSGLFDVSVVTTPAYGNGATAVQARKGTDERCAHTLLEKYDALGDLQRYRKLAQVYLDKYREAFQRVYGELLAERMLATKAEKRDNAMDEVIGFAGQMQIAHECAELCHSYFCTARDVLRVADDDETDDETDNLFAGAMMAAEICCKRGAAARAAHAAHKARKAK